MADTAVRPAVATETRRSVREALGGLGGRATTGDIMTATGLARADAEATLRDLLATHRGHLAVGEAGDLVWSFDPRLIRRDDESAWQRFRRGLKRALSAAFKAWIMIMLVAYFVIFVALIVAALVAAMSGDRRGGSRRHGRGLRIPTWWIWYMFWTRDWHMGRPYYGSRWERRRGGRDEHRVPFYKKVFAFVFGPDEPQLTQEQRDQPVLQLIRARRGVLTTAEYIAHTGVPKETAVEELGRLMGTHAGEVRVSQAGEIVYLFPELMVSAQGRVAASEPSPAWHRLERPRPVTGNTRGTDMLIGGMNAFNLVVAASAPWTIFPRLGLGGPLALTFLVAVPVVFSAVFFAIPLVRRMGVRRENERRRRRNVRKVLLGRVFATSIERSPITVDGAALAVRALLEDDSIGDHVVADELGRMVTEFEADVEANSQGAVHFRFPAIRRELEAGEEARRRLALDNRSVGEIVYSTADTAQEASRRELAAMDSELRRHLVAVERPVWMDDYEIFEEAMAAG